MQIPTRELLNVATKPNVCSSLIHGHYANTARLFRNFVS